MILSDGDVDDDIQYWSRDLFHYKINMENMENIVFTLDTELLTLQMSILHYFVSLFFCINI